MDIATKLYERLEEQLYGISQDYDNIIEQATLSFRAVESSIDELKAFISTYTFKDVKEEIRFFKEIKPRFYCKLIYFIRLFEIETNRSGGSVKAQRKYLRKQLAGINRYQEENQAFHKYYRSGANYMDEQYFVRYKFDILVGLEASYLDYDRAFCTSHDWKVAAFLANEQLVVYLSNVLAQLNSSQPGAGMPVLNELGLRWAETKVSFVEFIYALYSVGAFYNTKTQSKADVKDIAKFFELTLNINPGNIYRVFYDIRLRKKEPIPFIKKMDSELVSYIDQVNS